MCQLIHATTWMSTAVPILHQQVAPLRALLEKAYGKVGSRKKRAVKKVRLLYIGWDDTCNNAFEQVRDSLCNAVKIAHRDPNKVICVHTDASDIFWSGIVTQCNSDELAKP